MVQESGGGAGRTSAGVSGSANVSTRSVILIMDGTAYIVSNTAPVTLMTGETIAAGDLDDYTVIPASRNPSVVSLQAGITVAPQAIQDQALARLGPESGTTVMPPSGHDSGIPDAPGPSTASGHDSGIPDGPSTSAAAQTATPADATAPSAGGGVSAGASPESDLGIDFESASDEEIIEYVREELGFLAWMLDVDELKGLIITSLREGHTEEKILAGLQNTDWWRTTESQARQWIQIQSEDPATAGRLIADVALSIRLQAMKLGLTIPEDRINLMAQEAVQFGWVDLSGNPRSNLLTQAIFNEAKFRPDELVAGSLSVAIDDLTRLADDYMISLSADAAAVWAERIELGETDEAAFEDYIANLSASRFPHLKGIIESGVSPRSHFEPYRQQVAALLEVSPDEVDLFNDPRFTDIVETQTEQGVRSMTLAETQKYVRQMPEWQSTMGGMETAARMAEGVLQVFGER